MCEVRLERRHVVEANQVVSGSCDQVVSIWVEGECSDVVRILDVSSERAEAARL